MFGNVKNLIYNNITRVLQYFKHNSDGSLENPMQYTLRLTRRFFYTRTMYLNYYIGKKKCLLYIFFMKTDTRFGSIRAYKSTCCGCGVFFTPALSHDTQEKRFREK